MTTSVEPFDRFFTPFDFFFGNTEPLRPLRSTLPVDVTRQKDATVVTADLPGYEQGDVEVTVDGSALTIKASRRDDHTEKKGDQILSERHALTEVSRTLDFGSPIDASKVSAGMEKGVLTIHLPNDTTSSAKHIAIEAK